MKKTTTIAIASIFAAATFMANANEITNTGNDFGYSVDVEELASVDDDENGGYEFDDLHLIG